MKNTKLLNHVNSDENSLFPQEIDYNDSYKSEYDEMDDAEFWYTVHHGPVPEGKYPILIDRDHRDVRLVNTFEEKQLHDFDHPPNRLELNRYKVMLDEDGISARVVPNEYNIFARVCPNCMRTYITEDDNVTKRNFCSDHCRHEFHSKFSNRLKGKTPLEVVCFYNY